MHEADSDCSRQLDIVETCCLQRFQRQIDSRRLNAQGDVSPCRARQNKGTEHQAVRWPQKLRVRYKRYGVRRLERSATSAKGWMTAGSFRQRQQTTSHHRSEQA
jgi:hypothetical protein